MYTVWEFRNVSGTETKRVLRRSQIDDCQYAHYYQRIIYRGASLKTAKSYL